MRVIDDTGQQLGIMAPREALTIAQQRELDLIEVAPQAEPPVCRIMDYGRYKYEQRKRDKEQHRQSKIVELKTVRLRPHTDDHDFDTKAHHARKFLQEGKKVKVVMLFRGREMMHQDRARDIVLKMGEGLEDVADMERRPTLEGRAMSMILNPKPIESRAVREEAETVTETVEPPTQPTSAASGTPQVPSEP